MEMVSKNFFNLYENMELLSLPFECFLGIISSEELVVLRENELWKAVKQYIDETNANPGDIRKLLSQVKLEFLDTTEFLLLEANNKVPRDILLSASTQRIINMEVQNSPKRYNTTHSLVLTSQDIFKNNKLGCCETFNQINKLLRGL